ncbi:Aste57867_23384 [Aphanomyces stellatus]|uniref:Aste57867_23384 protein n=1 Tax=Aphanomyces stellatus TaxID=120398 RepID=A0A485LND3_9STRA|nr:hypothetical protein As57867_023313 [Aphanomyces stellatus]VFU00030.1 Aste57867_23384 [Aphanomyces stellatus]
MVVRRLTNRVQSCVPGVFSACLIAILCSCSLGAGLKWTFSGAKSIDSIDELIFFFVEWVFLALGLALVVLVTLAATLVLLFLLPQQFPARSSSVQASIHVRLCRLETLLLFCVLGAGAFLWHGLYGLLIDKEIYVPSLLTVASQAALLLAFLAFAPQHRLLAHHVVTDPIATLVSAFLPHVLVPTAQCSILTCVVFLLGAWYGGVPFSIGALFGSASLFVVVFTTSWVFSCLFLRTGYSWDGTGTVSLWLELTHPSMTCGRGCFNEALLHRHQPTTFLSIRANQTQNQVEFLNKRMASAIKEAGASCLLAPTRALEFWESYLQASDVHTAASSGKATDLFATEAVWLKVFQTTTAAVDGFTMQLQAIGQWKQAPAKGPVLAALASVVRQILSDEANPITVISNTPSVSSFVIDGGQQAVPSPVAWLEKWLAQALWQYSLATLLLPVQVVVHSVDALSKIVCVSYAKDKQGVVQLSLPAILMSLTTCRLALDALRLPQFEEYDAITHGAVVLFRLIDSVIVDFILAIDMALQKITATFSKELPELIRGFPSTHVTKLKSYVAC